MASYDTNLGAKRARETREAFGLDPAAPRDCLLTEIEETFGIPVLVHDMGDEIAGCVWTDGDRHLIHVNGRQAVVRQRFTLAHELGHVRCGHDAGTIVDTFETVGGRATTALEVQANAFAAEFLVPRAALDELLGEREPALREIVLLAGGFGVSAYVVLYRCVTCGWIDGDRGEELKAELDAGAHHGLRPELGGPQLRDRLGALDELPYLSPALRGSLLAHAIRSGQPLMRQVA